MFRELREDFDCTLVGEPTIIEIIDKIIFTRLPRSYHFQSKRVNPTKELHQVGRLVSRRDRINQMILHCERIQIRPGNAIGFFRDHAYVYAMHQAVLRYPRADFRNSSRFNQHIHSALGKQHTIFKNDDTVLQHPTPLDLFWCGTQQEP
jgi:hypothetical protein